MDLRPNPFPGKNNPPKPKLTTRKMTEASTITSKEPTIFKEKRVFGTNRNTNIPSRTATEKPPIKPSIRIPRKQPQRTRPARPRPITEAAKKSSPENPKPKSNDRTLSLQEEPGEMTPVSGPRTRFDSPSLSQSKIVGSKYLSAKICSKCRFDRLETSSYWLSQIKLAESVGKHFVSAVFFRLAIESKAEPVQKLNLELKRYLARNRGLAGESEWREVCLSYGLLKNDIEDFGSAIRKLNSTQTSNVEVEEEEEHHVSCETQRN